MIEIFETTNLNQMKDLKKLSLLSLFQENRILQDDLVWSSTQKAAASPRRQNFDRLERTHDLRWDFTLKAFAWTQVRFYLKRFLKDLRRKGITNNIVEYSLQYFYCKS